jgi:hypothetical protein
VAVAAEDATEQVERIMTTAATPVLMLLYAIMAISIVNLASYGVTQDVVGL